MNWKVNLAADLQRPKGEQPASPVKPLHPALDSVRTPWGWAAGSPARMASHPRLARLKPAPVPFAKVPVKKLDSSGFVKPWGW